MAIRHLQMGAAAAKRVAATGGGAESSPPPASESGYYVLGNNYADFANINPQPFSFDSYMCNKNIETFPDGIKKVGVHLDYCIYVLTSGNDLYAMGQFFKGDKTEHRKYYDFVYITGDVLDADVSLSYTFVIDTGNNMYACGDNRHLVLHDSLPSSSQSDGTVIQDSNRIFSTTFRPMGGSWSSINTHKHDINITVVGQKTDGKIYVWGDVIASDPSVSTPTALTSINDWTDIFLGTRDGIVARRSNGDYHGYGFPDTTYNPSGTVYQSNRLGIGSSSSSPHTHTAYGKSLSSSSAFPIASSFNSLNENFSKISIGMRKSALLTDNGALYGVGMNSYHTFGNISDVGYWLAAPHLLYSGDITDVSLLIDKDAGGSDSRSMIFASGGDIYGLGFSYWLHHHNPDNDLSPLNQVQVQGGFLMDSTSGEYTYTEPILMETGNWKYCFLNRTCRVVWNDTELGIGGKTTLTNILPKSLRNNSYDDITFISDVNPAKFENIDFKTYNNRGYCGYFIGNEFYVWVRDEGITHHIYPPDSGNYYILPDTLPMDQHSSENKDHGLFSLTPKKVSGVWDKAFVFPDCVFLTINNSGYFFGNATDSNVRLGDTVSYSSNLKVRYESGIVSEVSLDTGFIYPPEYIGYDILDVHMGLNYSILLTTDNKLYSCGYGKNGHLGLGNTTAYKTHQNITQLNGSGIVKIVGGASSSRPVFALASGGELYAWGNGNKGREFNPTLNNGDIGFVRGNVADIMVGGTVYAGDPGQSDCTYIITNDGELYSFIGGATANNNKKGQSLHGDTATRDNFTKVGVDSDWADVVFNIYSTSQNGYDESAQDYYLNAYNYTALARKTDNSIYIATDNQHNIMNSGFESLSTTDGIVSGSSFSTNGYIAFANNLRPMTLTQYTGIYASRIIGYADGFVLIPTG